MEAIKILYLHIYEDVKTKKIRKLLEDEYGKDNVISSKDKSKALDIFILIFIYVLCMCCIVFVFYILSRTTEYAYILILPGVLFTMTVFFIGSIIIYEVLYRRCLKKANKLFEKYKPNVIVAYQFGCILAMHLTGPRVPMLLISPVQENLFSKRIRNEVNISDFPYIIFVHSTTDRKRNLSKSLDLIESLDKRKYRVEIVNDDFGLELISNSDYKNWVDEVYAQTKGDLKRASKSGSTIDESLFTNA
ncbi:conserved Plasmodium protein, unknown function [Plasmodium malariae]|uniref:Uncharacterized protein n=1 Tax=Plasmodium malariae TaxID=5858 RepID=A0A1C3KA69_PLAMA|nr:conserved Plasmodium protein, unknown function [Plasmodium malariae]